MEAVGNLLPAILKRQVRRDESRVVGFLAPLWPKIAGKGIAENTLPVHFANGILTLETTCPTWAIQLRNMTEEIRAGINQLLGSTLVRNIKIRISPRLGQRDPESIQLKSRHAASNPPETRGE